MGSLVYLRLWLSAFQAFQALLHLGTFHPVYFQIINWISKWKRKLRRSNCHIAKRAFIRHLIEKISQHPWGQTSLHYLSTQLVPVLAKPHHSPLNLSFSLCDIKHSVADINSSSFRLISFESPRAPRELPLAKSSSPPPPPSLFLFAALRDIV